MRHWIFALVCLFLVAPAWSGPLALDDFQSFDKDQARIGQLLFYDKILSGNRNISCATCHHHELGSSDGLSLGLGEGGIGLGPERKPGRGDSRINKRIPRNAPALWNLGHKSVTTLFHDGRLSRSDRFSSGFDSPAKQYLPEGLNSIIAAQALFPMTAETEMAGSAGENDVADALQYGFREGWEVIATRVRAIPAYGEMFVRAFDRVDQSDQITIVEIANAIAAFVGTEWRNFDSPYDTFLADGTPLPEPAERGRVLFFGKARCASCHSGPLLTDQAFHAIGLPQFGPGRTRAHDPIPRDVGRMGVTDDLADAYGFRTPALRNIALTGPYGHNGAYATLRDMIRHMADPVKARAEWTPEDTVLPDVPWLADTDFVILQDRFEMERQARKIDLEPVALSDQEIDDLEAFLRSLTGASANQRPLGRPDAVPSGLPVD